MPMYDYKCDECGAMREIYHSMTVNPELFCEHCSGNMKRQISGLIAGYAKGAGAYSVDYGGASAPSEKRYSKK